MGCDFSRSTSFDKKVLVTGASGYLGQFVVDALLDHGVQVVGTTNSIDPSKALPKGAEGVVMDGADAKSIEEILTIHKPDVIVNTMALSSPAVCEVKKDLAGKLNGAGPLVKAIKSTNPDIILIHISTDQVYSGEAPDGPYNNESPVGPVNEYGRTKLLGEKNVASVRHHIILRSSGIYGPPPPRECAKKQTFLQMTVQFLKAEKKSPFFSEEKRSHIHVDDVANSIIYFIFNYDAELYGSKTKDRVYCMGGKGTWGRDAYAEIVAEEYNLSKDNIWPMTRKECKFGWAHKYPSPEDITMDSSPLEKLLGKTPKTLRAGVKDVRARETMIPEKSES